MELFFDPMSTTSRPVTFMAANRGIPLTLGPVGLRNGGTRTPEFLALSAKGKVPVLVDDGFVLTECTAILRYLATRHAPDLYPDELRSRARIDEAISWLGSDVYAAVALMTVYPRMMGGRGLSATAVDEMGAAAALDVERALTLLDASLKEGNYVANAALSIADFQALAYVTLLDLIGSDLTRFPGLTAWIARMQALSGWEEAYATFNGVVAARRQAG